MYNPSKRTIKRRKRTAVPQFLLDHFSEDVPISGLTYIPMERTPVPETEFNSPRIIYIYPRKKRARTAVAASTSNHSENVTASPCDLEIADAKMVALINEPLILSLKFFEVVFCECKTIPEQLAEMGMFPGSLKNTQFAIHFGLLEFMRNLRNVLATSDQGLVDLYNKVNPASEKQMTKTFFKSIFPAYTKLMMLVEDRGKNVSPASIGSEGFSACPNQSEQRSVVEKDA
ncbi:hypothetical protein F4703DRAFT_1925220 [Phycomyces blakesleeanus]